MVKRAIVWAAAVAALGAGAVWMSGCGAGETVPPVVDSGAGGKVAPCVTAGRMPLRRRARAGAWPLGCASRATLECQ
mgnify:FL=1